MVILVLGLGLALGLVLLGAGLAALPAPVPDLSHPGTEASPRPVNVIMRDYVFNPSPLYLVPGETVRLQVFNGGLVPHELVLGDAAVQSAWAMADALASPESAFATAPVASVPATTGGVRVLLDSGGSAAILYQVPRDEALQMVCHLPGHAERGMVSEVRLGNR